MYGLAGYRHTPGMPELSRMNKLDQKQAYKQVTRGRPKNAKAKAQPDWDPKHKRRSQEKLQAE